MSAVGVRLFKVALVVVPRDARFLPPRTGGFGAPRALC